MKTRNGFVSNSSSSSFIIVFPKEPTSSKDVLNIMFYGKEGGLSVYDSEGLSYNQISEIVYNDIKNTKPITKHEDLIDFFSRRYNYSPKHGHSSIMGISTDSLGGQWYEQHTKYWGLDQELLFKYRDLVIKYEIESNKIQEAQWKIEREWKTKNPEPKYAYSGGKDNKTQKNYTKKEIDTYNIWSKNKKQYLENHKEYKELENKRKETFKYWNQQHILEKELGTLDAKAFIKDNKKNFIYIVEYADDSHDGCTMEHGNVFKNIEHIRISNH